MLKTKIEGFDEIQEMLKEYREGGALELKKYRAIGTVEECRLYKGISEKDFSTACLDLKIIDELREYKKIGTVEECREAMERQRAKKPIDEYIHCISKVHQVNCPVCGNHVYADLCNITPMKYCQYCGQALSWERDDE